MGSFLPREQNARAWTHSIHSRHRTTSSFYMLVLIHILWNWCFVPLEVHCSIRPQQPRLIIFIGQKLTAVKLTSRTFSHTDEKLKETKQNKQKCWHEQTNNQKYGRNKQLHCVKVLVSRRVIPPTLKCTGIRSQDFSVSFFFLLPLPNSPLVFLFCSFLGYKSFVCPTSNYVNTVRHKYTKKGSYVCELWDTALHYRRRRRRGKVN